LKHGDRITASSALSSDGINNGGRRAGSAVQTATTAFYGYVPGGVAGAGKSQMIGAARVQVDFWDKTLCAMGGARQIQDGPH